MTWDFTQFSELQQRFRSQNVLIFLCNQFNHQEKATNEETLKSLKHVCLSNGYESSVFEKCEINGETAHSLFKFLKEALPYLHDDPVSLMNNPQYIIWSSVCHNDIAWNFEKFFTGHDGIAFKCYSRIQDDIEKQLEQVT